MSKSSLKQKISIKIAGIMVSMYIPLIKSHANGTFEEDIVILDPLVSQQIKKLPLLMYLWCTTHRFYGIIKQTYFYSQNKCRYEYGYRTPFAGSNTGWIESVQMSLLMKNDIITCFVGQKLRNLSFVTFLV